MKYILYVLIQLLIILIIGQFIDPFLVGRSESI